VLTSTPSSKFLRIGAATRRSIHIPLLFLTALLLTASPAAAINCARDSTGLIPLNDLGAGFYKGFQGGLYPGGTNVRPPGHTAAGLAITNTIIPLDTLGGPDPANGKIVLLSIGMSNTNFEFTAFIPKANADPQKNPKVLVVNGAIGGQSADRIDDPNAAYWDSVAVRLRRAGSSPRQAQVVWLKEAIAGPSGIFPASTDTLLRDLSVIVRIIKQKFPNVRLTYVTSRIYAGYATTNLNPEPYAYEAGFAVKWLIGNQIAGADSLNYDPARGPVMAPWLSWGPYLWADGLNPRSDGLIWPCSYFRDDGTHPDSLGSDLVADSLLAHFERDATTTPWFVRAVTSVPVSRVPMVPLEVAPNPARLDVDVLFATRSGEPWRLEVFNVLGERVRELGSGIGTGMRQTRRWDLESATARRVPAGVYWVRISRGAERSTRRVVVLDRG
jgi:hypothetical protein